MKIHKIQSSQPTRTANSTKLDLDRFTSELRELSDRHGIKLVSIGAMSGRLDVGGDGAMYLAIWENPSAGSAE